MYKCFVIWFIVFCCFACVDEPAPIRVKTKQAPAYLVFAGKYGGIRTDYHYSDTVTESKKTATFEVKIVAPSYNKDTQILQIDGGTLYFESALTGQYLPRFCKPSWFNFSVPGTDTIINFSQICGAGNLTVFSFSGKKRQ